MVNIALVADKQAAYVSFERDRILKDWGVAWEETRGIQDVAEAGLSSLFGDAPVSVLELPDKENIKSLVEKLKAAKDSDWKRWSTPGIIMLTSVDRNSTKTLEKLIQDHGGEVVLSKENSKDKNPPAARLVDELHISRDAKVFLKDFAGDDYSSILSLMKTLGDLTPKQQQSITVDDLLVRLPQAPGGIPPWEIEPAILNGNVTKAVELYRRVSETSSFLIVLAILKNKFNLVFKIASLMSLNPGMNLDQVAKALKVPNNYPLRLAYDSAKRIGLKKATQIIELMATTEAKVKGGSSGNPHVMMESTIVQVSTTVGR